ncbi:MAG: beta-lactamase class [Pseudomonadota bacterium]|nr:beta-lactamase class [Pseudomonadota bacterium]
MNQLRILITFIVIALHVPTYASSNKKIDDLARTFMDKNNVAGMSIAVIDKDKTFIFNYGYANEQQKTPTTSDTIYRIASFSKTYTATLAAIAATEGKLNLNDPFNKYFPDLKNNPNLNKITPNMLLAHVSSLPFDFTPAPNTYSDVVKDLDHFVPSMPPGSQYGYSNAGIGTMGYVLQNVYAKDYDTILADKISRPLKMNSTYLNLPADKEKYVALGHENNNKIRVYDKDIGVWFAAASLKSTITDMAKFLAAQINYSSLNDATLAKAIDIVHQNKYCFANKTACEQLGWQAHIISELKNSTGDTFSSIHSAHKLNFGHQAIIKNSAFSKNKIFIDKTCGGYGMSGYMAYIPEEKIGVVILMNKLLGDPRIELGRNILINFNTSNIQN